MTDYFPQGKTSYWYNDTNDLSPNVETLYSEPEFHTLQSHEYTEKQQTTY